MLYAHQIWSITTAPTAAATADAYRTGSGSEEIRIGARVRRSSNGDGDERVQRRDDRHRREEEEERRRFERVPRVPIRPDVARRRPGDRPTGVVVEHDDAVLDDDRHRADAGDDPDDEDDARRPLQAVLRLEPHRMADGDVPLDGEGGDRQDRRVRRRLGGRRPNDAERLAENPRIGGPERVCLLRQAEYELEQVGKGEVDEIEVSRRVHVTVAGDDDARRRVADDPRHEDDAVDCRHRDDHVERLASRSEQVGERRAVSDDVVRSRVVSRRRHLVAVVEEGGLLRRRAVIGCAGGRASDDDGDDGGDRSRHAIDFERGSTSVNAPLAYRAMISWRTGSRSNRASNVPSQRCVDRSESIPKRGCPGHKLPLIRVLQS